MNRLSDLETQIGVLLEPLKAYGLDILNSPNRCSNYRAIAAFYFTGESAENIKGCSQTSDLNFIVQVQLCDQRSHQLIYPYIEGVKCLLNNAQLTGYKLGAINYRGFDYNPYEDENGLKWVYSMSFTMRSLSCKISGGCNKLEDIFNS